MTQSVSPSHPAKAWWLAALFLTRLSTPFAATISATATDELGKPLPDAVVMVTPEPGTPSPRLEGSGIATAVIDQKDETFIPAVVVIRTGGTVTFKNSDSVRHHVYSFASIRGFEMVQQPGETSPPMRFDKPGAAAIGCNIHDQMIAHVFVTDAPWATVTDAQGHAVISGLPAGRFVATVWHPRLRPGAEPPVQKIALAKDDTIAVTIPVLPPRRLRPREY